MLRQTVKRALVIHVGDEREDVLFRDPGVTVELKECPGVLGAHVLERVDNVRFDLFCGQVDRIGRSGADNVTEESCPFRGSRDLSRV